MVAWHARQLLPVHMHRDIAEGMGRRVSQNHRRHKSQPPRGPGAEVDLFLTAGAVCEHLHHFTTFRGGRQGCALKSVRSVGAGGLARN